MPKEVPQKSPAKPETKDTKGLTATKESDFSEWFTQLIQKAELIEYSPVSGCYILRPNAYFIWEQVQSYFDHLIKQDGVKNCYFPLFIPESLLTKEKNHVEGFAPEVAWVDYGGDTKLGERLAVRPTSETIMYDAYAKWIRSHKDLPLRLNQWCSVVRWEFKHCTPFLRSREFLWQEGHTVFATKDEAVKEAYKILDFYEQVFQEMYAVPVLKGQKSEGEKFAGADFTLSVEAFLPNGKAIQGATSHYLGQNFAKAFSIEFMDENQQKQFAHQNSWGFSTRSIGVMILQHSDDKGLILPPRVAPIQVVIVPIIFDKGKEEVLAAVNATKTALTKAGLRVHVDDREGYTPGWKYNEWEVKGVPLRIEIGPKDVEKKQCMVARRDTGEKKPYSLTNLSKDIPHLLDTFQQDLLAKAQKHLKESIIKIDIATDAIKHIEDKKMVLAPWCGETPCEEAFKEKSAAKSLNAPFDQPVLKKGQSCFACKKPAIRWHYFGRSY
ncbi:proline--tRNA ligase [Candidatus Woesearchaeota archaeon]|nr:proline--tRNA ligase [Candidatus Woesearchaeota archaeon]